MQLNGAILLLALAAGTECFIVTPPALLRRHLTHAHVLQSTYKGEEVLDVDARRALNEATSRVARVCVNGNEAEAGALANELDATAAMLVREGEMGVASFLSQAVRLLRHERPNPQGLSPTYLKALDRLLSTLVGAVWRIGDEDATEDESERYVSEQEARSESIPRPQPVKKQKTLYELLGVSATAEQAEIRRAFRSLALETHPDVNNAPDALERFQLISHAYDVLYDEPKRALYDRGGEAALQNAGSDTRYTAADDEWAHLQRQAQKARTRKKGKRARARDDSAAAAAGAGGGGSASAEAEQEVWTGWGGVPFEWRTGKAKFGDVVLYPLPESVRMEEDDGREMGVGLVVGRNIDRGDAAKIPDEVLGLCEVAPLERAEDGRWREDEIAVSAYPHLLDLQKIPVERFFKAGAGEGSGWWALKGDYERYSPSHYGEEIIL